MPRSAARWKQHERIIATALGTVRQLHRDGRAGADVIVGRFGVQVKTRVSMPSWFTDAWLQSVRDCGDELTPVVVFVHAPKQGVKARRWAVMDFDELVRIASEEQARY